MNNKTINTIYKIFDNKDRLQGAYSRSYHTEYEFDSLDEARNSNCHGEYKDKVKYKISKYKVTYELIDDNVDPPTGKEVEVATSKDERYEIVRKKVNKEADKMKFDEPFGRFNFVASRSLYCLMLEDMYEKETKG